MRFWRWLFSRHGDRPDAAVSQSPAGHAAGGAERLMQMYNAQIDDLRRQLSAARTEKPSKNTGTMYYQDYIGAIPEETLRRIKANSAALSPTVRGMLLAIWAEPSDRTRWMALADYIQEFITLPEAVTVGGQKVATDQQLDYRWWRGKTPLHDDALRGMLMKYGHDGPNWNSYHGPRHRYLYRTMSLADVCAHSKSEIGDIPGIGPKRLKRLREWLGSLGLHLAGDEVVLPKTEQEE
jgi:hypothetical protein